MADGGELWVGDLTASGSARVLSFSVQGGNWRLGALSAAGPSTVTFADIGNTHGFGLAGNAVWQGRFSGGAGPELLFYNAGDSHWWLGGVTGADPQISWTPLAVQSVGWLSGAAVWVVDRDGSGVDEVVAYSSSDSSWWAGGCAGGALSWDQIGQTPGLPAMSATTAAGRIGRLWRPRHDFIQRGWASDRTRHFRHRFALSKRGWNWGLIDGSC